MAALTKYALFHLLPAPVQDVVVDKHHLNETQRLQDKAQAQEFVD